ncbi:MAG: FAD-dependent tricarballylate dehydrogenase TcuA [Chloroflexota bacterium]|nr:FAD-dependent tricarballylate dehydrogenase TcuA [Chloroflexota bacterium]
MSPATPHVVVVGAGNAALSAALSAREAGARVTVLEKAPPSERGGNTYFSGGGFRFPYDGLDDIRRLIPDLSAAEAARIEVGRYGAAQFRSDLGTVSDGLIEDGLADTLVREAAPTMRWLREQGGRWVLMSGRQAYEVGGKLVFFGGLIVEAVGGGAGLSDRLFESAAARGVDLRYEHKLLRLRDDGGRVVGVDARTPGGDVAIEADAVVLSAGGFEANTEMRTRYLGPGWDLAKVRGARFNTGDAIRAALDAGAQPFGNWSGAHAVAWDLNAPPTGNRGVGDLYQKHSYPYGIVVNVDGRRFLDEGADYRNYTYAKYGRAILQQPLRTAFQLFDQKTVPLLRDEYRVRYATKAEAGSMRELAERLGADPDALERTVAEFNAACADGAFNPATLDGLGTRGIAPPKSNWAQPLDTPPYVGFAVTCGITFTFGGLKIDHRSAQVLDTEERPIPGLYAAGELVGGLFYNNYAGGSGLMAGAVFGRIAGRAAAQAASG